MHLAGGMAALAGNLLLGRRILRPPVKDLLQANVEAGQPGGEAWQRRYDNPQALGVSENSLMAHGVVGVV